MPCCSVSDCTRTEALTVGGHWHARAPDGSWVEVPPESVVETAGNPIGQPVLCALPSLTTKRWMIYCFVPGPLS
jgi:hypothetical protein